MKTSILVILATLLTTAILVPSVITLTTIDEKAIAIDFSEEEKKEEKNEAQEKDYFFDAYFNFLADFKGEKITISSFYIEVAYMTSLSILLPPPEKFL